MPPKPSPEDPLATAPAGLRAETEVAGTTRTAAERPDRFQEECAVVGVFGHPEASSIAYLCLYALQHRGQEGSGICSSSGDGLINHRGLGLVTSVFDADILRRLGGGSAIGHNRYSTAGETLLRNTQPFVAEYSLGNVAVCHNGNFVNSAAVRERLQVAGSIFQSTSDTENLIHLVAQSKRPNILERSIDALSQVEGAYSALFLAEKEMIAARDPRGFRPMVLGRLKNGGYIVASETCALDLVEATYEREVEPGEVLHFTEDGMRSIRPLPTAEPRSCVFEYVYFARPDSNVFGRNVYEVRKEMGRRLARESGVEADLVLPVPDSGVPAALGYAEEAGIPFDMGLIRNHYVGRTFIEPTDSIRSFGVKVKLNAQREVLEGKRVVVIDDSIVRGTTSRKIVRMIRSAGAKEVHVRISAPPTVNPCYYGVDTPTHGELIANRMEMSDIAGFIEADSLSYLSQEGLFGFVGGTRDGFCDACFSGEYPISIPNVTEPTQMRLFEAMEPGPHAKATRRDIPGT